MEHVFANIASPKSRIALQVARKIALCDSAFSFPKSWQLPGKSLANKHTQTHEKPGEGDSTYITDIYYTAHPAKYSLILLSRGD